jgi:hypothetical protein
VTKVLVLLKMRAFGIAVVIWLALAATTLLEAVVDHQETPAAPPAEALYLQLGHVGLDPARVYRVRDAAIERSAIHISLEDGTIAFTQDVTGRVTGAFFEGDGELLLTPPNEVERRSMSLFTGMAILEERFATAYFRFNDDTMAELRPDLRAADNAQEFVSRWGEAARNLAQVDAMRLLTSLSQLLPVAGDVAAQAQSDKDSTVSSDRMLHARLQGTKLGVFDIYFDSAAEEQVQAGQARSAENGESYYDVWTSFSPARGGQVPSSRNQNLEATSEKPREDFIAVRRYVLTTEVKPPKRIHAEAVLQVEVKQGGARALLFELSRFLQLESVEMDGRPVEFIHNPAIEGTQLSRRGNDVVAVILPERARTGQNIQLRFVYGGEVLAEAGSGLLYVGARGTWYPNRGLAMADFDLEFRYPTGWTLVATGKPTPPAAGSLLGPGAEQTGRWVSERPIPLAGFNLGKYRVATAQAGSVTVETYATGGVERDFPSAQVPVIDLSPGVSTAEGSRARAQHVMAPHNPSPVHTALPLAEVAARAIQYYADRFGPYPYSRLALTQMPGRASQGWPGLVFLSSYAFLDDEEREQLHFDRLRVLSQQQIPAHETAHQWWGDLVTWSSYRDQWFSEGLANYCALMMLQEKNPAGFRQMMEKYRRDLAEKNKDGTFPKDAGPVTLGMRLMSSHFPGGYEAISYGRATWLFHMLRTMLQDGAAQEAGRRTRTGGVDEPFVRALRRVRQQYEGKAINTRELLDVFAEELPPALRYEDKKSLDWFLEGWVNGTALPRLELKAVKFATKGSGTIVSATILQKDAPTDLVTSVPVYAVTTGKPLLLGRVFADGEESSFHLAAPAGTRRILLDPNETILTGTK